jgi:citrate synthase
METSLGKADLDRVEVCGYDLTEELVGKVSFTDMVSLLLMGNWPTPQQRRMLDAMLVILIEHGMIGPVVAARFVYANSPEAIQGAVATSLLAAGSLHLGTSELARTDHAGGHGETKRPGPEDTRAGRRR